jgi:hypothetical protein
MITEESHVLEIPHEYQKANPSNLIGISENKSELILPKKKRVTFAEKNLSISPVSTVASP